MSFDTSNNWFYQKKGRKLHIFQMRTGSMLVPDSEGRLTPAADELIYPSEAITNGLRIEYTALDAPFISEALETTTARASGITMSFNDDGDSAVGYNDLYDTGDGLADFTTDDKIRVRGSASNDGDYTLTRVVLPTPHISSRHS